MTIRKLPDQVITFTTMDDDSNFGLLLHFVQVKHLKQSFRTVIIWSLPERYVRT